MDPATAAIIASMIGGGSGILASIMGRRQNPGVAPYIRGGKGTTTGKAAGRHHEKGWYNPLTNKGYDLGRMYELTDREYNEERYEYEREVGFWDPIKQREHFLDQDINQQQRSGETAIGLEKQRYAEIFPDLTQWELAGVTSGTAAPQASGPMPSQQKAEAAAQRQAAGTAARSQLQAAALQAGGTIKAAETSSKTNLVGQSLAAMVNKMGQENAYEMNELTTLAKVMEDLPPNQQTEAWNMVKSYIKRRWGTVKGGDPTLPGGHKYQEGQSKAKKIRLPGGAELGPMHQDAIIKQLLEAFSN